MQDDSSRAKRTPLLILASVAVLIAVAIVVTREPGVVPLDVPAAPAPTAVPPTATGTAAATATAPGPAVGTAPAATAQARPGAPVAARAAPGFDLVRVTPDGSTLVAGSAEPGAKVTVFAGGAPLAEVEADAKGDFVAIFRAEPSAEPRALTLGAARPGHPSTPSDEVVMLLPQPAPRAPAAGPSATDAAEAAASTGQTGTPTATGEPDTTAADARAAIELPVTAAPVTAVPMTKAPASAPAAAAAVTAEARPEVAATAILGADAVEASPVGVAPAGNGDVKLASIAYAEAGDVTLAGLGAAGAVVRAYVDDRFAKEVTVGPNGRWSMALDDVSAGLYRLRIDELAADGKVASRVETPFQRDYPRPPLPRPGQPAVAAGGVLVVQPGNNLWTLARQHYGSGMMYTQIFTANRELIGDPNLIYPGQIFAMPETGPTP